MPIYEYECQSCGKRLEVIQRVGDAPLETCECGDEGRLKKLISAPAFQFKGDGWYVTDYARKKSGEGKDAAKSDSGGGAGEGDKAKGSESKTSSSEPKASGSKDSSASAA